MLGRNSVAADGNKSFHATGKAYLSEKFENFAKAFEFDQDYQDSINDRALIQTLLSLIERLTAFGVSSKSGNLD